MSSDLKSDTVSYLKFVAHMKQCLFFKPKPNGANPLFHQHGWGLPLLVSGTTLLVQGEATQSPCVLAKNSHV